MAAFGKLQVRHERVLTTVIAARHHKPTSLRASHVSNATVTGTWKLSKTTAATSLASPVSNATVTSTWEPSETTAGASSGSVKLNGVGVPSFDSSKPFAVSYSPYTSSGGCKSVSAISSDLQTIAAAGFQSIRLYGTDCNQVCNVLSAISSTGSNLKLFLGIFDLNSASSEASTIISALNGDWSKVVTVSVGNEPVNQGIASVSTVISTTSAVRSQLRSYILDFFPY